MITRLTRSMGDMRIGQMIINSIQHTGLDGEEPGKKLFYIEDDELIKAVSNFLEHYEELRKKGNETKDLKEE